MAPLYALAAALCWTVASQLFACVSRSMTVRKVNYFKAVFSLAMFALLTIYFEPHMLARETIFWLSISGILGFALADLLLFYAYAKIGPARTLILTGFAPGIIALMSYLLFHESFPREKFSGLLLMFLCLFLLSKEKKSRSYLSGSILLIALLGILLDATGVAISKHAFSIDHTLNPSHANFHRILAALPVLALVYWKHPGSHTRKASTREVMLTVLAAFLGTFLALFFYLKALSLENAAIVAAVSLCAPVFSSIYEHIRDKQWPRYEFVGALGLMIWAVYILI